MAPRTVYESIRQSYERLNGKETRRIATSLRTSAPLSGQYRTETGCRTPQTEKPGEGIRHVFGNAVNLLHEQKPGQVAPSDQETEPLDILKRNGRRCPRAENWHLYPALLRAGFRIVSREPAAREASTKPLSSPMGCLHYTTVSRVFCRWMGTKVRGIFIFLHSRPGKRHAASCEPDTNKNIATPWKQGRSECEVKKRNPSTGCPGTGSMGRRRRRRVRQGRGGKIERSGRAKVAGGSQYCKVDEYFFSRPRSDCRTALYQKYCSVFRSF